MAQRWPGWLGGTNGHGAAHEVQRLRARMQACTHAHTHAVTTRTTNKPLGPIPPRLTTANTLLNGCL